MSNSVYLDFRSSNNSVSITNPHGNPGTLYLQAQTTNSIKTAIITGSMTGGTLRNNSLLTVKVLPIFPYKIRLWIVKDKKYPMTHSSNFMPSANKIAEEMTKTWGQQGAIKFEGIGSGLVLMDNVDPNGDGVEVGQETDNIVNKGLYATGKDIINIYAVYKLGPSGTPRGRVSVMGGITNSKKRYILITDQSDAGQVVPSHEFGHLCNLPHTVDTFHQPDLPDLSYWIPYNAVPTERYNWNLMNPVGYGLKIRWAQIDSVNQFINRN